MCCMGHSPLTHLCSMWLLFSRFFDPIRHRCVRWEESRNHSRDVVSWVHYIGVDGDLFKHHHGGHPSQSAEQTAQERHRALPHTVRSGRRTTLNGYFAQSNVLIFLDLSLLSLSLFKGRAPRERTGPGM